MPSFRHLLQTHAPLLCLDAASSRVQVGWWEADRAPRWASAVEEAGVGVFQCVERLGIRPMDAGAFVYCDGPGSILGIRTVAMAIRAWRVLECHPVFAYHSLAVVAHAIRRPELQVIADARRDSWHVGAIGQPLRRVPTRALAGELVTPETFRNWTPLPPTVGRVPYDLETLLLKVVEADLLRSTDAPDAFLHEEPSYATWTPQIHRAP